MKEIVIKIPDEVHTTIKENRYPLGTREKICFAVFDAIRNGKVLPKGHGRLIDADAVLEEPIGNTYKDIDIAETIIEADKED